MPASGHYYAKTTPKATIWAKRLVDGHDVELWSGERLVRRSSKVTSENQMFQTPDAGSTTSARRLCPQQRTLSSLWRCPLSARSGHLALHRHRRVGTGTRTGSGKRAGIVGTEKSALLVYFINSISLGRQVCLIHGSSGPYIRRIVNQLLPGTVASQLPSLPAGGFGAK